MADVDFHWSKYIKAGAEAFVLLEAVYPALPTQNRDNVEAKIEPAEQARQRANVALAQACGFK